MFTTRMPDVIIASLRLLSMEFVESKSCSYEDWYECSSLNVHRGQKKVDVSFPQSSRYSSEGIPTHTVRGAVVQW